MAPSAGWMHGTESQWFPVICHGTDGIGVALACVSVFGADNSLTLVLGADNLTRLCLASQRLMLQIE